MPRMTHTSALAIALCSGCTMLSGFDNYTFGDGVVNDAAVDSWVESDAQIEDTATPTEDAAMPVEDAGVDASIEVDASTYIEPSGPLRYQCQPCTEDSECGTGTCTSRWCHAACGYQDGYCNRDNKLICGSNGCQPNANLVRNCDEWLVQQWGAQ